MPPKPLYTEDVCVIAFMYNVRSSSQLKNVEVHSLSHRINYHTSHKIKICDSLHLTFNLISVIHLLGGLTTQFVLLSLSMLYQDDDVGDGTTSVTVLCGELLREAEKLVNQRLHPQVGSVMVLLDLVHHTYGLKYRTTTFDS